MEAQIFYALKKLQFYPIFSRFPAIKKFFTKNRKLARNLLYLNSRKVNDHKYVGRDSFTHAK